MTVFVLTDLNYAYEEFKEAMFRFDLLTSLMRSLTSMKLDGAMIGRLL